VRYIGCSNYPAWQLAASLLSSERNGLKKFQAVQPRYNALFRMIEEDILPLCQLEGIGTMVYNPLAGGMLTGRYKERSLEGGSRFTLENSGELYKKRYWNDAVFDAVEALSHFLEPRGKSLTHAALAWVLQKEGISSAIIGASKPEQLSDSLKAVELKLEPDELEALEGAWFSLPRERDWGVARR
jgi:1-deoxyxylulose-5-phosphate synthase